MADEMTGSTVPRRQLGRELRRLRNAAGMTREAAATALEWSQPKIWRIEKGAVAMRSLDVEAMCRRYGADGDTTAVLMALAKETKAKGWWHSYNDAIPHWFDIYLGLESAAETIQEYAPEVVPGLLQTEDYARAVLSLPGNRWDATEVDRRVELRMNRARLLTRRYPAPLHVTFFLNEAVVRRPVGDATLMAAQLAHIVQVTEMPNVEVRVLPFSAGVRHASTAGFFAVLTFDKEPDIVYSDSVTGALYLDQPSELAQYRVVLDDLKALSLDQRASCEFIAEAAKEYHHG